MSLKEAQSKIEDIVLHINEKKRDNEALQKTFEISEKLEVMTSSIPVYDGF